ncbi:Regulation of nuclear pre-mRNA domain-containing protein 1B [Papilio machaon]|uniref:Regulation of nuclear pre-mRNA domain-containing protein 1B n=1 Tax=Papilio machaon TaxID=76193 RepID=A0A0N0PAT6_PAPMA|nr:regulation of nuclear pre-mRNA domain-containing protein 1B [Papilio machaon]KPJ08036.1 Regulation of nuclear pre-mRNA domain-containing protein 1B [Papilio machaon]
MAGFTENALVRKLQELNSSQQSIQTLSLWLIHHRKHHAAVVKTWFKELLKAKDSKQLTFMYLANDVIQNSKKKGPEYGKEFGEVLVPTFQHMAKTGINAKTKQSLHRILSIWQERGVYDADKIQEFKEAMDPNDAIPNQGTKRKTSEVKEEVKETEKKPKLENKENRERRRSETKVEIDGHIETHVTLSPKTPPGDPPEPEELIKALLELESSASSDEAVRERIASLPPEVSEVQLLSKLADKEAALSLSTVVNSAVELLAEYNLRLTEELEKRRRVAGMLRDFAQAQRDLAKQAEARLEEYNIKLQKIYAVKAEVKSHIDNLPDVSRLPDVTGGLAPLPSAGDLFSI